MISTLAVDFDFDFFDFFRFFEMSESLESALKSTLPNRKTIFGDSFYD